MSPEALGQPAVDRGAGLDGQLLVDDRVEQGAVVLLQAPAFLARRAGDDAAAMSIRPAIDRIGGAQLLDRRPLGKVALRLGEA